jgi:hypothetical protein
MIYSVQLFSLKYCMHFSFVSCFQISSRLIWTHSPYPFELPIKRLKRTEVQEIINSLNPKITKVRPHHQQNPQITVHYWNIIPYAAVECSLAQLVLPGTISIIIIILIPKPGNPPPHELTSYCPICLLPIMSKVLESSLKKTPPNDWKNQLIPNHQFGFRQRLFTIEQAHWMCNE